MSDLAPQIQQLIDHSGSTIEDFAVCSGWILVAEFVDGEGSTWLEEYRTAEMAPWKRLGILHHLLDKPDGIPADDA